MEQSSTLTGASGSSIEIREDAAAPGGVWARRFLYGLLVVQIIVGFEFLSTVLVKLVRGGFVTGLAADLQDRVKAAPGWYRSLAESFIIPHASVFAYLVLIGELFVGVTLIATAIVWLASWRRLSSPARISLIVLVIAAASAGLAMNLNYHIANGAPNPWQLSTEVFDEGVDINTVLPLIEVTIVVVMIGVLVATVRARRRAAGEASPRA